MGCCSCLDPSKIISIQTPTINLWKMESTTTKLSKNSAMNLKALKSSFGSFSAWNHTHVLKSTPLRTLLRSAFKCRMAPRICVSIEIRIWMNMRYILKVYFKGIIPQVLIIHDFGCDVYHFDRFDSKFGLKFDEVWWQAPRFQEDPTTMFEANQAGLFRKLAGFRSIGGLNCLWYCKLYY